MGRKRKDIETMQVESICPICNKVFIPAPLHIYIVKGRYVCSYNCRCKYEKEHPKKRYRTVM